jgi:hypothetical protein
MMRCIKKFFTKGSGKEEKGRQASYSLSFYNQSGIKMSNKKPRSENIRSEVFRNRGAIMKLTTLFLNIGFTGEERHSVKVVSRK